MTRPGISESGVSPDGTVARPVDGGSGSSGGTVAAGGWGLPLVVLVVGMFMSVLDTSIVNVAIPTIQNEFGGTTDDVQWVITGYTLMLGVVVPVTAWLGERFGLTRVYNLALLMFATGSALCGLAWSLHSLVIFRIVQAIPGGILPVITLTIVFKIVPRERLGVAMGLYGLGVVFAPAVGPSLGGYLVEYVDWRLIFYINVPIGILGAVAGVLLLPSFPGRVAQPFDVLGFVTISGGLFTLLLALSEGENWKWSSYRILGLFTLSVLLLALFVVIELAVANPLLDIRIFRARQFALSMILIMMVIVVMYAVLFYIPLYLQQAQGLGAFDSGLTLLPQALVMAVLMPIAGQAYDRIGPRWLVTIGLAVTAFGAYQLRMLAIDTPREHVAWLLMILAAGVGLSMMPIFTSGIAALPVAQSDVASVFNNVVRNVSASFGVAGFTALLTIQEARQFAGRAALLPQKAPVPTPHANAAFPPGLPAHNPFPVPLQGPHLGPPGTPEWLSVWAFGHQTQNLVFVGAINDLFLISAALGVMGAVAAFLFMPSQPTAPAAPAPPAPPTQEAAPTSAEAADGRRLTPTADGRLTPTADGHLTPTTDGRHPTPTTDGQTRTASEQTPTTNR